MKVNKLERNANVMTIEVQDDYSALEAEMPKAFKELSKSVKIQGFRPGKVPQKVFESYYGIEVIQERAANNLINKLYPKLIEEKNLAVIDYPKDLEIVNLKVNEPFTFKLKVEVKPEIKLGKYNGLKSAKEKVKVTDEDIQAVIDKALEHKTKYEEDNSGKVSKDDIVGYSSKATIGSDVYEAWTQEETATRVGIETINAEFDEKLLGSKVGDEKKFTIKFADDYKQADVAGKKVNFEIKILSIRKKVAPELTDELVKTISKQETVKEYKAEIEKNLTEEKEKNAQITLENDLLKQISEGSKFDVPNIMVEKEIDNSVARLENSLKQSKLSLSDFLMYSQKTMEALREEYKAQAIETLRIQLCLEKIAEEEKIEVTDEDVDAEIRKTGNFKDETEFEKYKKKVNNYLISYMKEYLKDQKVLKFIVDNAKIK